jgi:Flp pilus assembly protein CpaB
VRRRSNLLILVGILFFLVGAAVVFVVIGDDDGGGSGGVSPGEQVVQLLVPTEDIAAGTDGDTVLSNGQVELKTFARTQAPANALTAAVALQGQSFLTAVGKGQPITTSALVQQSLSERLAIPTGYEAVAFTMAFDQAVAQYVAPGDRINLYSVIPSDSSLCLVAEDPAEPYCPRVELLLTNVLVLDVSAQAGTTLDQQAGTATTIAGDTRQRVNAGGAVTFLLAMRTGDAEKAMLSTVPASKGAYLYGTLVGEDAGPSGDTGGAAAGSEFEGVPSPDNAAPVPTTTSTTAPEDSEG